MALIQNSKGLSRTPQREVALKLIEAGLLSIQPGKVFKDSFKVTGSLLRVKDREFNLKEFERVYLVGFGKGSAGISKLIEKELGDFLTEGYVIDNVEQKFKKINFTKGTHPLPSQINMDFTSNVLSKIKDLTEKDLVLIVICGGGSAMFELPYAVNLETLVNIFKLLLKSGATISDMNVIRKHLSRVKGGSLAKSLYPATVLSLVFSDVPGSDLSTIASGPTVFDSSTLDDVFEIINKYGLSEKFKKEWFTKLPGDERFFNKVSNLIIVDNKTALLEMKKTAEKLGYGVDVYSDRFQGDAKEAGKILIEHAKKGRVLLAGGETTVKVKGNGKGGRNQTLVLASLPYLEEGTLIASFDSDGIDFYTFAGAIGDSTTIKKAKKLNLDLDEYLRNDNSYGFFEKTGDGILTGKLESNVSDLMLVLKS